MAEGNEELMAARDHDPGTGMSCEDEWQDVATAPSACHVLAARFDDCEWVCAVVMSPPIYPFTHWRMLPPPPASHDQQTAKGQVPGGQQGLTSSSAPALDGHCQAETETLGINAELLAAARSFVAHYPMGINPFLDQAFRDARASIARAEGRS